jgi:hypothetical protein
LFDLMASTTFCSAGDGSARSDIARKRVNRDARRKIDMLF